MNVFLLYGKHAGYVLFLKKGSKPEVGNYCGISLPPASGLEIVAHSELLFLSKRYITFNQHGFMPKRSTTSSLMSFISKLLPYVDTGYQVDTVYKDIKSPFDTVSLN